NGPRLRGGAGGSGAPPRATTGPGGNAGAASPRPRPGRFTPVVARYAISAGISLSLIAGTGRINPRPPVMIALIASSPMRSVTATRDAAPGTTPPCRLAP